MVSLHSNTRVTNTSIFANIFLCSCSVLYFLGRCCSQVILTFVGHYETLGIACLASESQSGSWLNGFTHQVHCLQRAARLPSLSRPPILTDKSNNKYSLTHSTIICASEKNT